LSGAGAAVVDGAAFRFRTGALTLRALFRPSDLFAVDFLVVRGF
jgi:hypothetical protein